MPSIKWYCIAIGTAATFLRFKSGCYYTYCCWAVQVQGSKMSIPEAFWQLECPPGSMMMDDAGQGRWT